MDTKVAVVLITRNEEKSISKTLSCLLKQDLVIYRIIAVNDGSTDQTGEIISKFEKVEIVNREKRDHSLLSKKELADTFNAGLSKLTEDKNCEYIMITGADLLFTKNYLSTIIERMKKNPKIAISSGVIRGELSIEPRGAGRVVRYDFWKKLGLTYPVNYGFEGYLLWKAKSLGYSITSYPDMVIETQRKTGSQYNPKMYFNYGLGLKALGYTSWYTIGRALLFARKKPKGAYYMLSGFFSKYDDLYESELRDYVKETQYGQSKSNYLKRIINILKH